MNKRNITYVVLALAILISATQAPTMQRISKMPMNTQDGLTQGFVQERYKAKPKFNRAKKTRRSTKMRNSITKTSHTAISTSTKIKPEIPNKINRPKLKTKTVTEQVTGTQATVSHQEDQDDDHENYGLACLLVAIISLFAILHK